MTDTFSEPQGRTPITSIHEMSEQMGAQVSLLSDLSHRHGSAVGQSVQDHWARSVSAAQELFFGGDGFGTDPLRIGAQWQEYMVDAQQRRTLYLDALRQRGDNAQNRLHSGMTPVLAFEYQVVVDGRRLDRPVNYSLVRILPGDTFPETRQDSRPWVIIDPRAGHGSGIGGFKADSEVGVALKDGHPVYFVIFHPRPVPGQTLADITRAEAEFLKTVTALHPASPKPLITGNCQGGWAAMILAATHPKLTGPLVLAGAPLSYWAGHVGKNPFRYYGGLAGGAVPALIASDFGGGVFDGAALVQNFEGLNPAKAMWRKNYDLYADVDGGTDRFVEFEKWWSDFYFMNEAEIRWIVENLFIGNKLTAGEAVLDDGTPIDLMRIEAPIVVFASHGDNITPPQQALNWIPDLYETTEELRARGRVIIYTLHETIGHLGIFVSAKVANMQHKQITSAAQAIEALPPGLYEMIIETDETGAYQVEFQDRQVGDIRAMNDSPDVMEEFAAVAELSDWAVKGYEQFARPVVQSMVTPQAAQASRDLHPMRLQMKGLSSENPAMGQIEEQAKAIRANRKPVQPDNSFLKAEQAMADSVERALDIYRDTRDAMIELTFHSIYANPFLRALSHNRPKPSGQHDLNAMPEVHEMMSNINKGGYAEAVVRMLVLLARARGTVRRDRLDRANAIWHQHAPFDSMDEDIRNHIIHEQSLIVDMAGDEALASLPRLLHRTEERQWAVDLVLNIAGPMDETDAATISEIERILRVLDLQADGWFQPSASNQAPDEQPQQSMLA